MEGDRILRNILNNQGSNLVKAVENYLSPVKSGDKLAKSDMMKYHTFSLKLLRYCIQGFRSCESGSDSNAVLQICKSAIEKLKITTALLEELKKTSECQTDRLLNLIYHILLHLKDTNEKREFCWFSDSFLFFLQFQSNSSDKKTEATDKNNIVTMIFKMQWALGKQTENSGKVACNESLCIRLGAVLFALKAKGDLMKYEKYLENCLTSSLVDKKNKNVFGEDVSDRIMETIRILYDKLVIGDGKDLSIVRDLSQTKATSGYLLLLSFKFILVNCTSKSCIERIFKMISKYKNSGIWSKLQQAICEANTTKLMLSKSSETTVCKHAKTLKQLLSICEETFAYIHKTAILFTNPKYTVILDIVMQCLTFGEPVCVDVLMQLSKLLNTADNLITLTLQTGKKKVADSVVVDEVGNNLTFLCSQWHSFLCWCLRIFQSWFKNDTTNTKCCCKSKHACDRNELVNCCLSILNKAVRSLSVMSEKNPSVREKESLWLGKVSFNFGLLVMKDNPHEESVDFMKRGMQLFYQWIESSSVRDNCSGALSKMNEVSLAGKQKYLVRLLVDIGDVEALLSCFKDFLRLLFVFVFDNPAGKEMIHDQVSLWTKMKAEPKIKDLKITRLVSKLMKESNEVHLKFLIEAELNACINKRETTDVEELLGYILEEYGENIPSFVSNATLMAIVTLPVSDTDLTERLEYCNSVINLLQRERSNCKANLYSQDALAMIYFHRGFFQWKIDIFERKRKLVETTASDPESGSDMDSVRYQVSSSSEVISSMDAALKIWSQCTKEALHKNSFEFSFKWLKRSASCLQLMGSIYSLFHQSVSAIHALHLASVLNDQDPDKNDTANVTAFPYAEIIRLLSELCDVSSAVNVLSKLENHNRNTELGSIQNLLAKATVYNCLGECAKVEEMIKVVLSHNLVSQKTRSALLVQADALMTFALSQEVPKEFGGDPPIFIGLKALKIFRSLFHSYFENEQPEFEQQLKASDSNSGYPWMVLDRLLSCLLYLTQRYRMQGSIPEAKSYIKEALVLCNNFSVPQRELEFRAEEAEVQLLLHEKVKAKEALDKVSSLINDLSNRKSHLGGLGDAVNSNSSCIDMKLHKYSIRYFIMENKCSLIADTCLLEPVTNTKINNTLQYAYKQCNLALKHLQNVFDIAAERNEKKRVRFAGDTANHSQSGDFTSLISGTGLDREGISKLMYYDEYIEMNCQSMLNANGSEELLASTYMSGSLGDIRNRNLEKLVCHHYRRSLARLYLEYSGVLLKSANGRQSVALKWSFEKPPVLDEPGKCPSVEKVEPVKAGAKTKSRKAAKPRTGRRRKCAAKEKDKAEENSNCELKTDAHTSKIKGCIVSEVSRICQEALSHLVPSLDCLLIKKLYNILSLTTGYDDVERTTYLEQLSFAMVLKQQMIMRLLKEERKSCKADTREQSQESKDIGEESHSQILPNVLKISDHPFAYQNPAKLSEIPESLPRGWRLCSMRISKFAQKRLIISRLQAKREPVLISIPLSTDDDPDGNDQEDSTIKGLVRDLSSAFQIDPVEEIQELVEAGHQTLKTTDTNSWWRNRKLTDKRIEKLLDKIESDWLGFWKGIILGEREDKNEQRYLKLCVQEFCNECKNDFNISLPANFVEVIFDSYPSLDRIQLKKAFEKMLGGSFKESILELFIEKAEQFQNEDIQNKEASKTPGKSRSRRLQTKSQVANIKRYPVILVLDEESQKLPWECLPIVRDQILSRMPSAVFTRLSLLNLKEKMLDGLDTENAFYVLNPKNDLPHTQKTFEPLFSRKPGWTGISKRVPTEEEYKSGLKDYNLFVYCGHGNGESYLKGSDIQRLQCKAVTILMGCSSGKLQVNGELEARGIALNYVMAGCPAIVANLWDVTDKDIDRFLVQLLKSWLEENSHSNLLQHISASRNACYMKFLVGASPIVYGLPVILDRN